MNALPFVEYQFPTAPRPGHQLVLVGEAPGAEEVRQGFPFTGRSGRLLDEALAAAGIDRSACLVANVFRHQPPGNKVGHFFASRARARKEGLILDERWGVFGASDRLLSEFGGEIDHLAATLAAYRARVIVALGRTPLWALTGLSGIVERRGQILACRLAQDAEVVPTFHPSFILRGQFALRPTMIADLRLALARLTAP